MSDPNREDHGPSPEQCVVDRPDDEAGEEVQLWDPFEEEHEVDLTSRKVMRDDGMPGEVSEDTSNDIPPLSRQNMICMGVYDEFVIRDRWGDIVMRFEPREVERAHDGSWRVRAEVAKARLEDSGLTEEERQRMAHHISLNCVYGWTEVSPIRPQCQHYLRQAMPYDKNPQHAKFFRMCALRRNVEGAMMNVGDTAIWACEGRNPRYPESEQLLERFDELKIEQGKRRRLVPIVGNEPPDPLVVPDGGILGTGGKHG